MIRGLLTPAILAALLWGQGQALAEVDAGAYLAARQADKGNDFVSAARFYAGGLIDDPANPRLLENAILAQVALGQMEGAAALAREMRGAGVQSQLAHLVLMADAAATERWSAIFTQLEEGLSVSPLVDSLAQAWAMVGQGDMTRALGAFDEVIEGEGMRSYGLYHKALALASVGDFEGAATILEDDLQGGFSARAVIAQIEVLSQLDRTDDALELLERVFGGNGDRRIAAMRDRLQSGDTLPFSVATTPVAGVGEVAYMIAGLLRGETDDRLTLQYARIGSHLDPANTDALMLTAGLLRDLGRSDLAADTFAQVDPADPAYTAAEIGRIDALRDQGREEAAIEVAQALARSHPELADVHSKLGDLRRMTGDHAAAITAYTTALDLYGADHPRRWVVLYTRAIASHAHDDWPNAEADFRAALDLNPDQPQVLNYLGYSLVERGEKLEEALGMIETAVAAQPENGAIVDSLGWVLFQLGRYDEAVEPMERAASLEAVDPIINDHLGDVYWVVGRQTEAVFQWNRALSFDPDEALATRIRAKLERGLDAVLAEEGQQPVRVAHDDG